MSLGLTSWGGWKRARGSSPSLSRPWMGRDYAAGTRWRVWTIPFARPAQGYTPMGAEERLCEGVLVTKGFPRVFTPRLLSKSWVSVNQGRQKFWHTLCVVDNGCSLRALFSVKIHKNESKSIEAIGENPYGAVHGPCSFFLWRHWLLSRWRAWDKLHNLRFLYTAKTSLSALTGDGP